MRRPSKSRHEDARDSVSLELIERCKDGDERAWEELVAATYRDVFSLCVRILGDPDDAREATQDAYLKAWRGLKGFRGDAQLSTWLYRIATNAAISKHRSRKRRWENELGMEEDAIGRIPARGSVEAAAGARVEVGALEEALKLLPEHYRAVVVLRDVYGLSIEEIASELKVSETAAKVRVHRARKKLKEMLWRDETEAG